MRNRTAAELEIYLGEELKKLRLHQNLRQVDLASQAGLSLGAVKGLESGKGATMHTLMCVLKALGQETWLEMVAPIPTVNPLVMTQEHNPRMRATSPNKKSEGNRRSSRAQVCQQEIKIQANDITASNQKKLTGSKSARSSAKPSLTDLVQANVGNGWSRIRKD